MPDISIFTNKAIQPNNTDLVANLGTTYRLWTQIQEFVY